MRSKLKWGDFAIIAAVLVLAAAVAGVLSLGSSGDRLYAEVWQDNVLVERTATMQSADCRDQVCVRTGTLTRAGQVAVCLPNRVVLRITGETSEIDAVVS